MGVHKTFDSASCPGMQVCRKQGMVNLYVPKSQVTGKIIMLEPGKKICVGCLGEKSCRSDTKQFTSILLTLQMSKFQIVFQIFSL